MNTDRHDWVMALQSLLKPMNIIPTVCRSSFAPISQLSNPKRMSCQYHKFSISLLGNSTHPNQFNQILSHAIAAGLFSDPFISSKLLYYSLSLDNDFTLSRPLFFQIQNPNIFAWNFMFRAYSQSSFPDQSISLYNRMRQNGFIVPDNHTFPFILKACARLSLPQKGQEIHSLCFKLGLEFDIFVQNALISMYSLCGMIHVACKVFDLVPVLLRDVVSWNSMLSGYLQSNQCENALKLFGNLLHDRTVRPNEVTILSALTACARVGLLDLGKKIHGLLILSGCNLDVFVGSSLVDMYAKCRQIEEAHKVFDRIPDRNVVCWTSIIAGYTQSDLNKEAIQLFRDMQVMEIRAEAATIACIVSACGHLGALDLGRWLQTYCERNNIELSLTVKNAFIDMYSKCGDISKAIQIFRSLTQRDLYSWTAMISGLAMNGEPEQALLLFSEMEMCTDIRPNEVTFLGVLSACNHGGFVDKGFYYIKAMTQNYNLIPRIEHYGCIVDLLGRANLLVEAKKFIATLPIQPDAVIWRSLLFACRNHGNIELAEHAANQIEELEPRRCGARVLLSNAYASASLWSEAKRVRKEMVVQNIQKQPGCSFVEINGGVHEFYVVDGSSYERDAAFETAARMNEVLQSERLGLDLLNF